MITSYEWLGVPYQSPSVKKIDNVEVSRNLNPNPTFNPSGYVLGRANNSLWHNPPEIVELPVESPSGNTYGQRVVRDPANTTGMMVSLYDIDDMGDSNVVRWFSVYVYSNVEVYVSIGAGEDDYILVEPNTWARVNSIDASSGWGSFYVTKSGTSPIEPEDEVYWTDATASVTPIEFYSGDTPDYQIPNQKIFFDNRWVEV